MSEAQASTPQATPTETSGSGVTLVKSFEERSLDAFGPSESAAADGGEASASPAASTAAAVSGEPDPLAKARAERRAALEKLKDEERRRVDWLATERERDRLAAENAELKSKSEAYAKYVDPTKITKEQFFQLAQQNPDITPKDLGEWLREQMANPELAAQQAAKAHVDPKIAALEKRLADQQAVIDQFMQKQEAASAEAVERAAAQEFFAFTSENAATSPVSARFLQEYGPDEYYKVACSAVRNLPKGAGPQAILDEIEEKLGSLQKLYAPVQSTQQRPSTPQPQNAAAQAPTHVSNSLAQQRSSVVDEDADWASLPFEERSARLFR